ncbi:MAG: hypothetical protein ACJ72I_09635 [Pseudonocardiaceae bacterium]
MTVGMALSALLAAFLAISVAAALVVVAYRRFLRRRLADELLRLSGPSIVRALLPQQVMTTFLSEIYGDSEANRDVVAGVLGGVGAEPHGGDLTISIHTTVDYELRAVNHHTFELISTVSYSFKENVANHRFAIFAMCDPQLRDSITLACRLPLFESWFVPDQSLFEQSVDAMLPSVHIGIRYTDLDGEHHEVMPAEVALTEMKYQDWPEFLTFFRGPVGTMPRQNPSAISKHTTHLRMRSRRTHRRRPRRRLSGEFVAALHDLGTDGRRLLLLAGAVPLLRRSHQLRRRGTDVRRCILGVPGGAFHVPFSYRDRSMDPGRAAQGAHRTLLAAPRPRRRTTVEAHLE